VHKVEEPSYHFYLSIFFKKTLSRGGTDERFHYSTAQDLVNNIKKKLHEVRYGTKGMTALVYFLNLSIGLHLCLFQISCMAQV
jgi:hypothetical protein